MLDGKSDDYKAGFQDAMRLAVEMVMRNRDHNRRLSGHPFESHDDAMKRIYSTGFRRGQNQVTETAMMMEDAIDLYVVLPPSLAVNNG
jgi:hypothetical protein